MIYTPSYLAIGVFAFFVLVVLGLSFYLGAKAKSASGYYAAHGEIPWFVNGIAFAGDYLSAASFLGICGMIAFYGYDGFLYSIGFLAGWIVALFVVAEPLKRMGKFTFADALDSKFHSRGIKLSAAISTLVVSIFYLIPQMVGAGALIKPLLGLEAYQGVILVGVIVILIVVTAGMVSTTWVQFIKGALLVLFCTILTFMILQRGLSAITHGEQLNVDSARQFQLVSEDQLLQDTKYKRLPETGGWKGKRFIRLKEITTGRISIWSKTGTEHMFAETQLVGETQYITRGREKTIVNGLPRGHGEGEADLRPVGHIVYLGNDIGERTGPLNPFRYLATLQQSFVLTWSSEKVKEEDGDETTVYYQNLQKGSNLLSPGGSPLFADLRKDSLAGKLNFFSLMLALFGGTASLPHILIRYYTVKDQASARKSTMVGIAAIGFFYVLTLFLGLGAMTSGVLDPTDSNMAAPLLARSFGELPFAVISAIAFTTVLGTVSGLILAASGAVAHDLLTSFLKMDLTDHEKVRAGKIAAVVVGAIAIVLGILFKNFNVSFLVGWAFNVAASANLPALVMLLFWKGTTKQGITWGIFAGLFSSLAWVLASGEAYKNIYGLDPSTALVPFSQPAIVTLPLGFAVLIVVSLLTRSKAAKYSTEGNEGNEERREK
ncbi:MAG: cation acetate symporter [Pirellulaceae bacterium]|nr:cation acetate symporter [Pirellulaceae bacterium]